MVSNKINTLLDELNYSNWNSVLSSSKNAIMDYNTDSTTNCSNTYTNTSTSSPYGIDWSGPYIYTSTPKLDSDMLQSQIDELNNKIKTLECDNSRLKAENNQLKSQNDAFEARLKQLEALVRTAIENIEE